MSASAKPSVRIEKTFSFKGGTHVFSNRYYFSGGTPSSGANWDALMDAIVNLEKTIYVSTVTISRGVAYAAGSDVPVRSKVYTTAGTNASSGTVCPGECAALGRWSTAARSSKNHPIYAFSYWHSALRTNGTGQQDLLDATQKSAMLVYANGWVSGITAGGVTAVRSTRQGHDVTGAIIEQWITHRDFPPTTSV